MTRAYRLLAPVAMSAALALSSACSILPKSEPLDIYRLPVNQSRATAPGQALLWSLQLLKPQAGDALNSARIAVIPRGHIDLTPEYGFNPPAGGFLMKFLGSEHIPMIGHRHRIHAQFLTAGKQLRCRYRPVQ